MLGYSFSRSLHTALRRAVTVREGETTGVIPHAERGTQHTSTQLANAADDLGVRLSVGRTGVCWDNAPIKSLWSTRKTENYDRHEFKTDVHERGQSHV